jgi:hypothetical protein
MTSTNQGGEGLLPPITTFDIEHRFTVGPRKGQLFRGSFEYRVPNAGIKMEIARAKAILLPKGTGPDIEGAVLVEMTSYLLHTITKAPGWWTPEQFYDTEVIAKVYEEATDYEARFLGEKPRLRRYAQSDAQTHEDGEGDGDLREGAMDGDVPPSRKRREVLTSDDA